MRKLTKEERIALQPVGPPGECVTDFTFAELERLGYGVWDADGWWTVTASGKRALALDLLADNT